MKDSEKIIKEIIVQKYETYLNRTPNNDEINYHYSRIIVEPNLMEQLDTMFKNSFEHKLIQDLNHGCVYTKFGTKMYLNKKDMVVSLEISKNKTWENEETLFLKKIIKRGMNVLDVGSNIGFFTILLSKWVGEEGKVFSIEPDPENFKILSKNIKANQCKNTQIFQKAISNFNGTTELFLSKRNKGDHRIKKFIVYDDDMGREHIRVECSTLDFIIPKKLEIDFIKMDIQGSEMFALKGMNRIMNDNKNLILFIEFWPFGIKGSGADPKKLLTKILDNGFNISIIKEDKLIPYDMQSKQIDEYTANDFNNFICQK